MQKFTRPLTREIELAGQRLALTMTEQGLSVRPVGARKPPREIGWARLCCLLAGSTPAGEEPTAEELNAVVEVLKKGPAEKSAGSAERSTAKPSEPPPSAPAETSGVTGLLKRLERWLSQHRRRYLEGLLPPASPAELEAVQTALGRPIPDDLRALLSWHNGQSEDLIGHFQEDWDLMSTKQIVSLKRELDAGEDVPAGWQPVWIAFLEDNSRDFVCLDSGAAGAPVREVWQGKTEHAVVAPSLAAWLAAFVQDVESGKYHEEPERGSFLRRA